MLPSWLAGLKYSQVLFGATVLNIPFYLFMTNLGVASEAIDLVYQLNTGELGAGPQPKNDSAEPLESLHFGREKPADLVLPTLPEGYDMMAFRIDRLVLEALPGDSYTSDLCDWAEARVYNE